MRPGSTALASGTGWFRGARREAYADSIRGELGARDQKVLLGISFGCADESAATNALRMREAREFGVSYAPCTGDRPELMRTL
ncbi:hypothetical protein [Saccharopolyspora gloriosae]|uniref:hypothetical protein n=1 Tax=Saccharopolyspora gloriosae TaxID=455344 RepID=UPI001FB5E7D5|nr:hypothetical protein [Saccharopolyspora gloriosae]